MKLNYKEIKLNNYVGVPFEGNLNKTRFQNRFYLVYESF